MVEKKVISTKAKNTTSKVVQASATSKVAKVASKGVLTAPLFDLTGKSAGTVSLPGELFNVPTSPQLLAQYVRVYLANQRQGTASTKTRSEITGSTRKIYKQKGTGRARHGAKKAPIFVGGGVAFGPKPQDHTLSLTKKQRTKALLMTLSAHLANNSFSVIANMAKATGKTKQMNTLFTSLNAPKGTLFVYSSGTGSAAAGASNLATVVSTDESILNAYDVIRAKHVVFAQEALDHFLEVRQKNHEN